jgi:hypothetical protein
LDVEAWRSIEPTVAPIPEDMERDPESAFEDDEDIIKVPEEPVWAEEADFIVTTPDEIPVPEITFIFFSERIEISEAASILEPPTKEMSPRPGPPADPTEIKRLPGD